MARARRGVRRRRAARDPHRVPPRGALVLARRAPLVSACTCRPLGLVAAQLAGSLAALVLGCRQTGRSSPSTSRCRCWRHASPPSSSGRARRCHPAGTRALVATFSAVLATDLVSPPLLCLHLPQRRSSGRLRRPLDARHRRRAPPPPPAWPRRRGRAAPRHAGGELLLVLAATLHLAYRAYATLRQQHERLRSLLPRQDRRPLSALVHAHYHHPRPGPRAAPGRTGRAHLFHRRPSPDPYPLVSGDHHPAGLRSGAHLAVTLLPRTRALTSDAIVAPLRNAGRRSEPCWWPTARATSARSTPTT